MKGLGENIEKLVDFMKETGGTVEDYVRLNADYSNVEEDVLLREYYKQTKPHLNREEIEFIERRSKNCLLVRRILIVQLSIVQHFHSTWS